MNKKTIWIATANTGKAAEYKKLFANYEVKTLLDIDDYKDIVEDGDTFEANAMIKAKDLAMHVNGIAIGDDSGICVDQLNGFPGIYSKRWAEPIVDDQLISQALLDKLNAEHPNELWTGHMNTSIAIYDATTQQGTVFTGIVEGAISPIVIQLEDGFGYDNIFMPNYGPLTYSQMGTDEKIKSSARTLALNELKQYMKEQGWD